MGAGTSYLPDDKVFMDVVTSDPFASLEAYGRSLRTAQGAQPTPYTYPTVDAWYTGVYTNPACETDPSQSTYQIATSAGLVAEMDIIANSGFLSYAAAGVRMVPDMYSLNNMNGWYDDAHYQQYGYLTAPYTTLAAWGSAVQQKGGLPGFYMQALQPGSPGLSQDFRTGHTNLLLAHDASRAFDYTNPDTQTYMRSVFAHFKQAGIASVMFDYCDDHFRNNYGGPGELVRGGMSDPTMTVAATYRKMFELAKSEMGPTSRLQERGIEWPGYDICLGVVDSHRLQYDSTIMPVGLAAKGGLRWYKNRVVLMYDLDARDILGGWRVPQFTGTDSDGLRMTLTAGYVTASRLLLGNSFRDLPAGTLQDLKRVAPYHTATQSARPVDAFVNPLPSVYDFAVDANWHLVTLLNNSFPTVPTTLTVPLAGDSVATGALGLDTQGAWHAYDFWNRRYIGLINASGSLNEALRAGEARMIALHRSQSVPQFLSTNRHIMQGYLEISNVAWQGSTKTLSGTAQVVAAEPFEIVIAGNGHTSSTADASQGTAALSAVDGAPDLVRLTLSQVPQDGAVTWNVHFSN